MNTDVLIEVADRVSKRGDQIYEKIKSSEDDVAIPSITMYDALYCLKKYAKLFQQLILFRGLHFFSNEDTPQTARLEFNLEKRDKKSREGA